MKKYLIERYANNSWHRFQNCQTINFIRLLSGAEYTRVCDIGAGKGYWSYVGVKKNLFKNEIDGCDIFNDYQIEEITALNREICLDFKLVEGTKLPFVDGYFDLVFSMDVIEHVENDHRFFSEHIRIAKPGGTILIGTPNRHRLSNLLLKFVGKLHYPRIMGEDSYGRVVHLREYERYQLINLINLNISEIDINSVEIIPCWFGHPVKYGCCRAPPFLENFCQFWFVKFKRR